MRSLTITVLVFGISFLAPPFVVAESTVVPNGPQSELAANAALQYWQAFAQMPPLDTVRQKLLDDWKTVRLDDPDVQKLLAESHASMKYLWRAAKLKQCDWGLDYNDGISMMLPHLAKSRDLARLAICQCLDGRRVPSHADADILLERAHGCKIADPVFHLP